MSTKLAVIPARGGSTRLKDKNIYPLAGKPLICYTIEAVLESQCFDTIIVSTDSPIIAKQARQYSGIEIYDRPAEYSGERITVVDALLAMMDNVPKHDVFAYFLPTCPFRNAEDITNGVQLIAPDVDTVISVCQYEEPIQFALLKRGNDLMPLFDNLSAGMTNSKYITRHYRPSGGYYMAWWDRLRESRNFFTGNIKGVALPPERSVDIDTLVDIHYAESLLDHLSSSSERHL